MDKGIKQVVILLAHPDIKSNGRSGNIQFI